MVINGKCDRKEQLAKANCSRLSRGTEKLLWYL